MAHSQYIEGIEMESQISFFPHARDFIVSGGEFTSTVVNKFHNPPPSDFRNIPPGYLDLRIRLDNETGVVSRCSRRVYSARISKENSNVTAIVYQGRDLVSEWTRQMELYTGYRHPNILQVYAVSQSRDFRALISLQLQRPILCIFWRPNSKILQITGSRKPASSWITAVV
ncbi:hypothetical protein B0H10DRAFT_40390 [Mycena sp. CBHHK59/15]|nr:hypothetical protein B0H10DRAFT_40390 [Mycena sp. CBHHK59/15]